MLNSYSSRRQAQRGESAQGSRKIGESSRSPLSERAHLKLLTESCMPEEKDAGKRINFKSGVADLLYRQAGGRCSVPRCTNPTMGPHYASEGAVNMGVACHIYSAAEDGPRGWGGQGEAFISSEANGIWCCQYHSVLIDKKKGRDYPATQLFAWKELAEARARKQMNDVPSPLGWVDSIEFTAFVRHLELPRVELSRCSLLWAENGAGKSALMQVAAATSDARHGERFLDATVQDAAGNRRPARFAARVTYSTVDTVNKSIDIEISERALTRTVGITPCLLPPGDIEMIYCSEQSRMRLDHEDDLDFLMRVLNLDKSALLALSRLSKGVLMPGTMHFAHADEDSEDEAPPPKKFKADGAAHIELSFKKKDRDFDVSFAGLSSSEQSRLILDLFIAKAREVAKQRLTLLMIEDLANSFDDTNFATLLNALTTEPFQSLVTLPPKHVKSSLDTSGAERLLKDLPHLSAWRLVTLPPPLQQRSRASS